MAGTDSNTMLAVALATGKTREEAAEQAGLSVRTVYRRLADPGFVSQLQQFRDQIENQITIDLSNAATAAVRVLHGLAVNASDDSVKLKAANSLLEHFRSLPGQQQEVPGGGIPQAELGRKLEIAYQAGKYGYILAEGRLPPEIEERLPTDPRAHECLIRLVEEKLDEMRARETEGNVGFQKRLE